MSRVLGRIPNVLGDQIFVRAQRKLVPTPRAKELRERVNAHAREARLLLTSRPTTDLRSVRRSFHVRIDDTLTGGCSAKLLQLLRRRAPHVELRCLQRVNNEASELRDGSIDLDIGVANNPSPEIKMQILLEDVFAGVVRRTHPMLQQRITAKIYASKLHVNASEQGETSTIIDSELESLGLKREVALVVPSYWAALGVVADSDLVAAVPSHLLDLAERLFGVKSFRLPFDTSRIRIVQAWHPRLDDDPAHKWLRTCVRELIADYRKRHQLQLESPDEPKPKKAQRTGAAQ
jgi:DNA-binding transcriptional LysR family regulator